MVCGLFVENRIKYFFYKHMVQAMLPNLRFTFPGKFKN